MSLDVVFVMAVDVNSNGNGNNVGDNGDDMGVSVAGCLLFDSVIVVLDWPEIRGSSLDVRHKDNETGGLEVCQEWLIVEKEASYWRHCMRLDTGWSR